MRSKKFLILGGLAIILIVVLGTIIYRLVPGKVNISLSSQTAISQNVSFSLSSDDFKKEYQPPQSLSLRSGHYKIFASAPGSSVFTEEFTVRSGLTTKVEILLKTNLNSGLTDTNPDNPPQQPDYLKLFPHIDKNFEIKAKTKVVDKEVVVESLTIVPYVAAGPNDNSQSLAAQKNAYVAEAKQWLKDNHIPTTITLIVDSPF